jgi:hypothetical protein
MYYSFVPNHRYDEFLKKQSLDPEEKKVIIKDFEGLMRQTKHKHCKCCHKIKIKHDIRMDGICMACHKLGDQDYFIKHNGLPIWYENGDKNNMPQFYVPNELKNLSMAEKMLIQKVSPFVPMQHIKNGIMGLKGHVCAFEQDINELAQKLPRRKEDFDMIRIEQFVRQEIGSEAFQKKAFKVSRTKVLAALLWLKRHSRAYHDIEIDESALDWINEGDIGYFQPKVIQVDHMEVQGNENQTNDDLGPIPVDGKICRPAGEEILATG